MAFRAAKPIFPAIVLAVLAVDASAAAQSGPIDLFEDQDKMQATTVQVESDGGPVVESGVSRSATYTGSAGGGFTLSFERTGSTILVPVTVNGREVYFLFDTGASYTSISGGFARAAGLVPPKGAPAVVVSTANGHVTAPLGIIDSLVLGGRTHVGVTYGLCEGCPGGQYKGKPIVGLLGMNVIGRYRTSFDHGKGVIEMTPSDTYADRWRDIDPWLQIQIKSANPARKVAGWVIIFAVKNRSPRTIHKMTMEFWCQGGTRDRATRKVGAKRSEDFAFTIKDGDCQKGIQHEVLDARW